MVSTVRSLGLGGISGYEVSVECYLSSGLPSFDKVGYIWKEFSVPFEHKPHAPPAPTYGVRVYMGT